MTYEHGVIILLVVLLAIEKYCNYLERKAERKNRADLVMKNLGDPDVIPSSEWRTKTQEEAIRLDPVLGNDW